jgi:alkanesulfonate monooxygenase SsuD/methylene tetrahydromethanopterin reductase-like flavin-dependent oxidoreductase (luciferase family)
MQVGAMCTSYNHKDWERLMTGDYSRPSEVPDPEMMDNALRLGDQIEPLGFDSLWTTEHYGSAYSMQPNPLQWLAYWAGRTERVDLGTAVVVVPWWNPVRLAHEISMLDILLRGRRLLLGLGRGVSEHEYASLGVPRDKSRDYFYEILDVLRASDGQERFSYDGEIFKIPPTTVRPQPVAGEPLSEMSQQVAQFNQIRATQGLEPDQPTAMLWMYCAETEKEAEIGYEYYQKQQQDARNHYFAWNSSGFEGVKGYEAYAEVFENADFGAKNLWEQRETQLIGTPEQVIKKAQNLQQAVSLGYLVVHASYADMPVEKAEASLRLFSKEVLPALHEMDTPLHAHSLGTSAEAASAVS